MYEDFFGFSRRPFSLTPDPEFLYWTDQHRSAFDLVRMSLLRRAPIALITGEVGAGKTTLLQALLREISEEFEVGLLSNVVGDSGDLLRWILTSFGYDSEPASRAEALREVEALLASKWEEGRRSVLIIDEAQNISDHGIETLRLLTNINAGKCAPLSLIVAGQPELRHRIGKPAFTAFRQRLGASFHLGPMTLEETAGYIRNRIGIVGGDPEIMDDGAIEAVYRRAKGVPRLTNLLCDVCFVAAFAEDRTRIDRTLAESALAERLAFGGLGGLPAEADAAEPEAAVVMRRAATSGKGRSPQHPPPPAAPEELPRTAGGRRPSAPPSLRLVTAGAEERPVAEEEPPLRLTTRAEPEPAAAALERTEPAPETVLEVPSERLPAGAGNVVRRLLGSAAGLAVAASIAVAALILPATGTDGSQAPAAASGPPATREFRASAAAGEEASMPTTAGPLDVAEARLAPPDPGGAQRLFERALREASVDPSAAAIEYSRAAARGHGRAAYYLAQMYETGDGVPFAPDTAWNWYAASTDDVPGAEERLGETATFATAEAGFADPMFSAAEGGVVELVWQGRGSFVVELATEPDAEAGTLMHTTALTAARLEVPEDFGWWRVRVPGSQPPEWMPLDMSGTY